MTSWITSVDEDCLNILDFDYDTLRGIVDRREVLYWEYHGQVMKVPGWVLADAVSIWADWQTLQSRRPEAQIPSTLGRISLSQTVRPKESSAIARARRLHPHQQSSPQSPSTQSD